MTQWVLCIMLVRIRILGTIGLALLEPGRNAPLRDLADPFRGICTKCSTFGQKRATSDSGRTPANWHESARMASAGNKTEALLMWTKSGPKGILNLSVNTMAERNQLWHLGKPHAKLGINGFQALETPSESTPQAPELETDVSLSRRLGCAESEAVSAASRVPNLGNVQIRL